MSSAVTSDDGLAEARAFAESVAGVMGRHGAPAAAGTPAAAGAAGMVRIAGWAPGALPPEDSPALSAALDDLGWPAVATDPELLACAGLGGLELGRALAPLSVLDGLLGASPLAGSLIRCRVDGDLAVGADGADGAGAALVLAPLAATERVPSSDGLDVHRVAGLGDPQPLDADAWRVASAAWLAAGVGYLAGVGEGALELTVTYARQRRAFDSTLAALAPVQQLLARAATEIRGVRLLAATGAGADALAHAGPAIADACAACQQVTGAIGFTLEYPLQRYTQRARALAVWNDALLEALIPG
jgi:butyryl-CoA dehydrogenase